MSTVKALTALKIQSRRDFTLRLFRISLGKTRVSGSKRNIRLGWTATLLGVGFVRGRLVERAKLMWVAASLSRIDNTGKRGRLARHQRKYARAWRKATDEELEQLVESLGARGTNQNK